MAPNILVVVLCVTLARKAASLQCYNCDSREAPSCGPDFKAYQFNAESCPKEDGVAYKCGKEVQPPLQDGWIGVIRACYSTGTLPGLNATNGCEYYHVESGNFTPLYCFCDTDYCNAAGSWAKYGLVSKVVMSLLLFLVAS